MNNSSLGFATGRKREREIEASEKIWEILANIEAYLSANLRDEVQRDDALQLGRSLHDAALSRSECEEFQTHQIRYLHKEIGRQWDSILWDRVENGQQTIDWEGFWPKLSWKLLGDLKWKSSFSIRFWAKSKPIVIWGIPWRWI